MTYWLFQKPDQLVQALYCFCSEGRSFPENLYYPSTGGFAVDGKYLGDDSSRLETLAKQTEWNIKPIGHPIPGSKNVPTRNLVADRWHYRDPLLDRNSTMDSFEDSYDDDDHAFFSMDPRNAHFIVAAENIDQAKRLLTLLTGAAVRGLRSAPVDIDNSQDTVPYLYFWAIMRSAPPVIVAGAAARIWKRLANQTGIFIEWPWEIDLHHEVIKKINESRSNQSQNNRLLLLSREPPEVINLGANKLLSLTAVADLRLVDAKPVALAIQDQDKATIEFDVTLRLIPKSWQNKQKDHIRHLALEVEAKQLMLEHIVQQSQTEDNELSVQLLFVYREPQPGIIPLQIRRLLVEWSDQETELGALLYQKVQGQLGCFPGAREETLHIVTTGVTVATLKGMQPGVGAPDINYLLAAYQPDESSNRFQLLPDWLPLAIFQPHELALDLYPDLPMISNRARDQLAKALLGDLNPAEYLVLLVAGEGDGFQPYPIEIDAFQPLVEAVGWRCAVDLTPQNFEAIREKTANTNAEKMSETLAKAIKERVAEYIKDLDAHIKTIGVRTKAVDDIALTLAGEVHPCVIKTEIKKIEFEIAVLAKKITPATLTFHELEMQAKRLHRLAEQLKTMGDQIINVADRHRKLMTDINEQKSQARNLYKKWFGKKHDE